MKTKISTLFYENEEVSFDFSFLIIWGIVRLKYFQFVSVIPRFAYIYFFKVKKNILTSYNLGFILKKIIADVYLLSFIILYCFLRYLCLNDKGVSLTNYHCAKKCLNAEVFLVCIFLHIWTEYAKKILRIWTLFVHFLVCSGVEKYNFWPNTGNQR